MANVSIDASKLMQLARGKFEDDVYECEAPLMSVFDHFQGDGWNPSNDTLTVQQFLDILVEHL